MTQNAKPSLTAITATYGAIFAQRYPATCKDADSCAGVLFLARVAISKRRDAEVEDRLGWLALLRGVWRCK